MPKKRLKLLLQLIIFLVKIKFKRQYDILFFSDGVLDEQWIRSTLFESHKQKIKCIIIIFSEKKDENLINIYSQIKIDVVYIKNKSLLRFIKSRILITATSCIDRNSFHKSIEKFIYMPHSFASLHSVYPENMIDCFDAIFASGPHHSKEFEAMKKSKKQKAWIYNSGYGKLDLVKIRPTAFPVVLLAPSWGYYDFTKVFNLEFLSSLLSDEYHLVFRPHPLVLMRESEYINQLKKQSSISIDTDLCGNYNLEQASVLITDYSGISMEFMALHKKPVIFLSTQEKIINTQFQKYDIVPMEHLVRNMSPNIIVNHTDVNKLKKTVLETLSNSERHPADNIDQFVFNQGSAGSTATKFVMEILKSE